MKEEEENPAKNAFFTFFKSTKNTDADEEKIISNLEDTKEKGDTDEDKAMRNLENTGENFDADEEENIQYVENSEESDSLEATILGEDVIEILEEKTPSSKKYFSFFASAEGIEMIDENYGQAQMNLEDDITGCEKIESILTEVLPEREQETNENTEGNH